MERNLAFPRSLRYFLAVAEHRNFTRASEVLNVSQPTLSQQIKQLEDLIGVQLLERSTRHVRLTAAGETYVQYVRRSLSELDEGMNAVRELRNLGRGTLRLGMTPITDIIAAPLLGQFNSRYPEIRLSMTEMSQKEIENNVLDGSIEIGIVFANTQISEGRLSEIDSHILVKENLNFVVGAGHRRAAQKEAIAVEDFGNEPLVLFNTDYALRRHIDSYCREYGVAPPVAIQATSLGVIIEVVRLGRFATILPDAISANGVGLHSIPLSPALPPHVVTLICRKGAHKSPACQAFGTLAAEWASVKELTLVPSLAAMKAN